VHERAVRRMGARERDGPRQPGFVPVATPGEQTSGAADGDAECEAWGRVIAGSEGICDLAAHDEEKTHEDAADDTPIEHIACFEEARPVPGVGAQEIDEACSDGAVWEVVARSLEERVKNFGAEHGRERDDEGPVEQIAPIAAISTTEDETNDDGDPIAKHRRDDVCVHGLTEGLEEDGIHRRLLPSWTAPNKRHGLFDSVFTGKAKVQMASSLLLLVSGALLALANPQIVSVEGEVADVLTRRTAAGTEMWASTLVTGGRRLTRILAPQGAADVETLRVPKGAVFVDACPPSAEQKAVGDAGLSADEFHFVDESGLVAEGGRRVIAARPLTSVADPSVLFVADLCPRALAGEIRVPVSEGILVRARDSTTTTLPFDHRARAFSGRVHRGLRPARSYAAAVSVYAPRLFDVDVDGDGVRDLVVAHEERVVVFARRAGRLDPKPLVEIDLMHALGENMSAEHDLRILVDDVDGDRRADMLVGVTTGALPERSSTWLLTSGTAPFAQRSKLVDGTGLVAPIAVVVREGAPRVLFSEVDTSMISLGAVLLSGSVDVKTALREPTGARQSGPTLAAAVDVRRARMVGALPIADVDLDGDGLSDLLDLGIPGRAIIYRGTSVGYESRPHVDLRVPGFTHVVSLPHERAIVLVGAPAGAGTRRTTEVAIVRGTEDDRRGPSARKRAPGR